MRARLSSDVLDSPNGGEMASILRACVHCGFCNAVCPTYRLRGDELDGPRGRIYLIKSMLEGGAIGTSSQMHLDRCLTCRACETTCPSGVRYGRLLELARPLVEERVGRAPWERCKRWLIRRIVPHPRRFASLMAVARMFKPAYPAALRELVPAAAARETRRKAATCERKMVLLDGCVQQASAPGINAAASEIFNRLGVQLLSVPESVCCGAVPYHLGVLHEARRCARRNVDAWSAVLDAGAEAVVTASTGCAMMLKEYAELLADDPNYAERAARVSSLVRDPCEVIDPEMLGRVYRVASSPAIAFHAPCTMQHGLRIVGLAEACLRSVGFELTAVPDSSPCCGSAGTFSLLQPRLGNQLLDQKLAALQSGGPGTIATANIGCLIHLRRRADRQVVHWLELIRPHRIRTGQSGRE
ncbi:MAG: glycolate oxidase subunit GlcF [Gammaproteobacteria bacterium]|jgi:glycolate oxidase iron-sulfur subunit|nr:glycolate oxidase subunit GlcF [Gammaproteobacteria bacterium]